MPDRSTEYIFVYGTLRKAAARCMHRALSRHCTYVADGSMQGKLYEVGGYPGAVESGDRRDTVRGELYKIEDRERLFTLIDDYEECAKSYPQPQEYVRKKLTVTLDGGGSVLAWVYLYNHDVSGLIRIESGDYVDRLPTAP